MKMHVRFQLFALSICWVISAANLTEVHADEAGPVLRAGAATSNITPPLGEPIVGNWAALPATNIHDELHARCLVLDDGQTQVGFVVCDILNIADEVVAQARELIATQTPLPAENILIAATHTHSATPAASENYRDFLAQRIADGVSRAYANAVPAKIGFGSVDVPSEVFVRRWYVLDPEMRKNPFGGVDEVRMNPPSRNPALLRQAGVPDPEVAFLAVQSLAGEPICLLANYSLHYVGGVPRGDVSADYFGIFSRRIADLITAGTEDSFPPFVGMMSNGTSGDINNIDFKNGGPRKKPYEKMTEVAEKVAQKVYGAYQNVEYQHAVSLAAANRMLTLKRRKPDAQMQKYFANIMAGPDDKIVYYRHERTYAKRVQNLLEGPDEVDVRLQVIRIGDWAISAIPFEVFAEIGLELKDKTPFEKTFTIELANGSHGYLPTPAQHKLGGYETWMGTNRVQLDASDRITKNLLEMMSELKP